MAFLTRPEAQARFETLQRAADEKADTRRCTADALADLTFPEQVAWLVDGLFWTLRTGRMHVWDQNFLHCLEQDLAHPGDDTGASDLAVTRLPRVAGELASRFPEVARLVAWTMAQVSPAGPPTWWPDVIHNVWDVHDRLLPADRGLDAFRAVAAASWPEDRDPAACSAPRMRNESRAQVEATGARVEELADA